MNDQVQICLDDKILNNEGRGYVTSGMEHGLDISFRIRRIQASRRVEDINELGSTSSSFVLEMSRGKKMNSRFEEVELPLGKVEVRRILKRWRRLSHNEWP